MISPEKGNVIYAWQEWSDHFGWTFCRTKEGQHFQHLVAVNDIYAEKMAGAAKHSARTADRGKGTRYRLARFTLAEIMEEVE